MRASGVGRSASPRPRMARYSLPRTETARSGASPAKAALPFNDDGESAQRGHHHQHFDSLTFGALLMSVVGFLATMTDERPGLRVEELAVFSCNHWRA